MGTSRQGAHSLGSILVCFTQCCCVTHPPGCHTHAGCRCCSTALSAPRSGRVPAPRGSTSGSARWWPSTCRCVREAVCQSSHQQGALHRAVAHPACSCLVLPHALTATAHAAPESTNVCARCCRLRASLPCLVPAPKSLRDLRRSNVSGFQIGVISPYRKQVQKLQRLLDRNGPSGVQV